MSVAGEQISRTQPSPIFHAFNVTQFKRISQFWDLLKSIRTRSAGDSESHWLTLVPVLLTAQGLNSTRMIRWIRLKQDAFRPFEQNLKKVNIVGTYGAIYSVGIQIDRNSEMRQGNLQLRANLKLTSILAELVDCMRELFQQVREEIHTLRVELSEVRAELSALVRLYFLQPRKTEFSGRWIRWRRRRTGRWWSRRRSSCSRPGSSIGMRLP